MDNQVFQKHILSKPVVFMAGALTFFAYPPFFIFPILILSYWVLVNSLMKQNHFKRNLKTSAAFWAGFYLVHFYWFFALAYSFLDSSYVLMDIPLRTILISGLSIIFCIFSALPSFIISCCATAGAAKYMHKMSSLWQPLMFATALFLSELFRGVPYDYGSPWALTGYTVSNSLPLIQLSNTPAVIYGLSLLVLIVIGYLTRPTKQNIIIAVLITLMAFTFGHIKLKTIEKEPSGETLALRIIQTNTPLEAGLSTPMQLQRLRDNLNISQDPNIETRDLVVWSENAVPHLYSLKDPVIRQIQDRIKTPILTGAIILNEQNTRYQNAIALIDQEGLKDIAYKNLLVPYAEYNPIDFLDNRFFKTTLQVRPQFSRGNVKQIQFQNYSLMVLNCYEMIFSGHVKKRAENADLIFILANDAWFKRYAPHMVGFNSYIARMRAVETRRPVIRSANGGEVSITDIAGKFLIKSRNEYPIAHDFDVELRAR